MQNCSICEEKNRDEFSYGNRSATDEKSSRKRKIIEFPKITTVPISIHRKISRCSLIYKTIEPFIIDITKKIKIAIFVKLHIFMTAKCSATSHEPDKLRISKIGQYSTELAKFFTWRKVAKNCPIFAIQIPTDW